MAASDDVIVAAILSVDDLAAVDVPGIEVVGAEANLDPDTAVTGVVDADAGLGKWDADPAAAVNEAAGVLETEGRDEAEVDRVAADFFLAWGSSPSKGTFRGRPLGLLNGIISAN